MPHCMLLDIVLILQQSQVVYFPNCCNVTKWLAHDLSHIIILWIVDIQSANI